MDLSLLRNGEETMNDRAGIAPRSARSHSAATSVGAFRSLVTTAAFTMVSALFTPTIYIVFILSTSLWSHAAHATGGQCKWEGGLGLDASCKQQDCIEDGGEAVCTDPEIRPPSGANDGQVDGQKYSYGMCDEEAAQIAWVAQWCAAEGGTWVVTGGGTQQCQGLPADYPGVGTATNEGSAIAATDKFAKMGSCSSLTNDTGWGLSDPTDQYCWSGSPVTKNGINTWDIRKRTYSGTCGGGTVKLLRSRRLVCPNGYATRTKPNANHDIQCFIVLQCCDASAGNPVDFGSGNKRQEELDYKAADGLQFSRYYNSQNRFRLRGSGPYTNTEQDYWRVSYLRTLTPISGSTYAMAAVQREDGAVTYFDTTGKEVINRTGGGERLLNLGSSGWQLTRENNDVEYYDASGRLTSVVTRAGVTTTIGYDTSGRMALIANSFGRTLALGYDTGGRLSTLTLPDGNQILYDHDDLGRPTSVTYADGATRSYVYEDANNSWLLSGIIDENGIRFSTYSYNSSGQVASESHAGGVEHYSFTYGDPTGATMNSIVTDPLGRDRQFLMAYNKGAFRLKSSTAYCNTCINISGASFDANGNYASKTDLNGKQTTYVYDLTRNLQTSRTEAAGTSVARTITTTWDPAFRLPASVTEPNRRTDYTYDANGNTLTLTITDTSASPNVARTWTYTYDSFGHVLTVDGPRTDVTDQVTYTYYNCSTGSECGQLQTVTDALGDVTTYNTYTADGYPLIITDPNGVITTLAYDERQRVISRQVAGETTTFEYWPTGQIKKVTQPGGSFLTYVYDDAHRLTEIDDALGNRLSYILDVAGNRQAESRYDPYGALVRTRSAIYNALGELWQQLSASQADTQAAVYTYDAAGNRTRVDAPMGRSTVSSYDALNRISQIVDPSGTTSLLYDGNDNLTRVTDPRGLQTQYAYTGFGELKSQTSPDTGSLTKQYDLAGNLATSTDARGAQASYGHDANGRVSSVAYSAGGITDQTITYSYDSGSNARGRVTSAGDGVQSLSWTYDALGRVTSKTFAVGTVSKSLTYGYTSGLLTSMTLPSGQGVLFSHDAAGRVSDVSLTGSPATTVLSGVLYDAFGPVSGWTWGNGTIAARVRDLDGYITQIESAGASTYTYYDDGTTASRLDDDNSSYVLTSGATNLTVSQSSNRVTASSGALARSYSYDAAGNPLVIGAATLTYNNAGRLSTVTQNGVTTMYAYNALGQRVRKTNSSSTMIFAYDEAGHLVGEYDGSGAVIQETVWLDNIPVATLRPTSAGGVDVFYVHTDHLNTPRRVTRPSDNAIVWRWNSDPYGRALPEEDPDGDASGFIFNLRFPGQYYDVESGFHYNYMRDYDASTGRYLESDPLGLGGGINTYSYVGSDPMSQADPFGLFKLGISETWSVRDELSVPAHLAETEAHVINVRCTCEACGSSWKLQECSAALDIQVRMRPHYRCPQAEAFARHGEQEHVQDWRDYADSEIWNRGNIAEQAMKEDSYPTQAICEKKSAEGILPALKEGESSVLGRTAKRDTSGSHAFPGCP